MVWRPRRMDQGPSEGNEMSKENQKRKTGLAKVFAIANARKAKHTGPKKRLPKKVRVIYIGGRTYSTLVNDV